MASTTYKGIIIDSAHAFVDAVPLASSQNSDTLTGKDLTVQWRGADSCLIAVRADSPAAEKDAMLLHPGNSIYALAVSKIWVKGDGVLVPHEDA